MVSAPAFFIESLFRFYFDRKARLAVGDLFKKFSYRYTQYEAKSLKTPLVYLKAGFLNLIKSNTSTATLKRETCLYDNASDFENGDRAYLNALGIKEANFLFKDKLPNHLGRVEKFVNLILLGFLSFFLLPWALISKDKARSGLIFLELSEITLLLSNLRINGAKKLLILSSYEKEICFTSWYIQEKLNAKVYLFPSPNPIKHLYKNVICDTFVFSAPFQKKEYELLKNNWYVNKMENWPPYGFQDIEINKANETTKNTIGFVSSGMELRRSLQHVEPYGNLDYEAETTLISCLQLFLSNYPQVSLIVYLHPREKMESNMEFTKSYYKKVFGDKFKFAPIERQTKACLSLCDVAVSGFSSAQFERLFGGYKTLFAPLGFLSNYFSDNTLDLISIHSKNDFDIQLLTAMNKTVNEYFETEGLKAYRWDSYSVLTRSFAA